MDVILGAPYYQGTPVSYEICLVITVFAHIKAGIEGVEVLGIQLILSQTQSFAETLEMHDFALTQELDGFTDIRLFNQTQDIVIGAACFLFCCQILVQIGNDITL